MWLRNSATLCRQEFLLIALTIIAQSSFIAFVSALPRDISRVTGDLGDLDHFQSSTSSPFGKLPPGPARAEIDESQLNRMRYDSSGHPNGYRTGAYLKAGSTILQNFNKGVKKEQLHPAAQAFMDFERLWNTHDYSDQEYKDWLRQLRAKRRREVQKLKRSGKNFEGDLETYLNREPTRWEKMGRFLHRLLTPRVMVEVSKSEFLQQLVKRLFSGAKKHNL